MVKMRTRNSYKNFNVAIYCPVSNINSITDLEEFDREFQFFTKNIKVGRVYIEDFRGMEWATKEQLLKVKGYFESKGIETAGGITTCDTQKEGFASLCYSSEEGIEILRKAVALNAEIFDEFIFDDFYFINCRCPKCIEKKKERTWSQFRMEQKRWVSEEIVMKTAKEINPNINVILKYPQWFEVYNETGYDLDAEPRIFDSIYTGTETRNPDYAQQHLPKYLSYFIMRYLESAAPERNLGGWFDPYECTYNLTSYLEQGYLTLFAGAKEVTLFCLGSMLSDPQYHTFLPALSEVFEETDRYLEWIGKPIGAAAYRPGNARGEDNLHSYLGMCGIPFEAYIHYPEGEKVVFLAEGAAYDGQIVEKMKKTMLEGGDVIVTSGFVRKLGETFGEFVNVSYSARKALVREYADTKDNGLTVSGKYTGAETILIPQIDYCTNDIWELAAAYGNANNYPIVLRCVYGTGHISIITIPDNMGDLYAYPAQVLGIIRSLFCKEMPVMLEGPSGVELFVYDNNRIIVRSDLPYSESITLKLAPQIKAVRDMVRKRELPVREGKVTLQMAPSVNYVLELMQ